VVAPVPKKLLGKFTIIGFVNVEHVSGACQVFRRECSNKSAAICPVEGGSIDHIAVITARMKGWRLGTFTEKTCLHHRAMGTAGPELAESRFKLGVKELFYREPFPHGSSSGPPSDEFAADLHRWLALGQASCGVHPSSSASSTPSLVAVPPDESKNAHA